MFEAFIAYNQKEQLFTAEDKVLLTVSGGIDSMCMLFLFMQSDINFGIAHCNFQLRGTESDGDEKFIKNFASQNNIPFHVTRFDTENFAKKNKLSIQMAARELRYNWFEKVAEEHGYSKIATAHNRNDAVETFFINLTRGTGIKGLTGIKSRVNHIIRPVLFATRKEIELYSQSNNISFREDSSNADTKYLRNSIRHNIITEFEKLNPSFLEAVIHASEILYEAEIVYAERLKELKAKIFSEKLSEVHLSKDAIRNLELSSVMLYELLVPFGYTKDNAAKILKSLDGQSGKTFYSEKYQLLIDRKKLIISEISDINDNEYKIESPEVKVTLPIELKTAILTADINLIIPKSAKTASLDLDKLKFPLTIKRWHSGDYFYPFGMTGKKKLSDFFTDQKFSLLDKKNVWLLCSGNDIVWIIGHRIDNRFAISKSTKHVLQIELLD